MKVIGVILSAIILVACTISAKIPDYRRSLNDSMKSVSKMEHKMDGELARAQAIVTELLAQGADAQASPYRELQQKLDAMSVSVSDFKQLKVVHLEANEADLVQLGNGKINSKDPTWPVLMGSRKRVAKDYDRFQDIAGQLRQQMEEFSAVLKANQIGEVDISSVRGQARTVADKLTRFRVDARTNLNQAKSIASRIHPDHRNDYTGKVQQAETMVAEVESAAQRMLDSIEHFLTLTEGRTKLWVGPQTDYYHAFTRAMGQQSELNGSLAQLNNLFAQIQSIIKAQ